MAKVEILMKKRVILIFAFVIVLASVSFAAADESGFFTINIFNSPKSQIHTEISNSTIMGQTNYTNSKAVENITSTNSTLTININGQNLTITDQGDSLTINSSNQTPTPASTANPTHTAISTPTTTPQPLLSVTFIKYALNHSPLGNGTQYDFYVTVGVPTSLNYPWGKNVTHEKIGQALIPIATKYNLLTNTYNGFTTATWQNRVVVDGENNFSLWSNTPLTQDQIQSLTSDLYDAFSTAMK